MLFKNAQLEAMPEASEETFKAFIDAILGTKQVKLTDEMSEEEIEKIIEENTGYVENKINDSITVKIGAERVAGRGLMRYATLIEGDVVNKFVLWPVVTSKDGIRKVGLRSYNDEDLDKGVELPVSPSEFLDFVMTLAVYMVVKEK